MGALCVPPRSRRIPDFAADKTRPRSGGGIDVRSLRGNRVSLRAHDVKSRLLFLVVPPSCSAGADAAGAPPGVVACIFRREGVAIPAVRFRRVYRGAAFSAQNIRAMADWLKVVRVAAGPVPTKMVEFSAVRNSSPKLYVNGAMDKSGPSSGRSAAAVALAVSLVGPLPAERRVHGRDAVHKAAEMARVLSGHPGNIVPKTRWIKRRRA